MIKEGRFGVQEAVCLLTLSMTNKIFFTTPGFLTRSVGTSAWYMTLVSCISATIFFTFIYLLLKRFPGMGIIEIYELSLGRVFGFAASFILMAAFLFSSGIYTREFTDVMKVFVFPHTPPSILTGALIAILAASAYLGLESIARCAKLAAYISLVAYLLLLVLASEYYKASNLLPIFGYGLYRTVTTGLLRSSAYAEIFILAVFAGALQGIGHVRRAGYVSLLLSGLLLSLGLLCYSLMFEYTSTQEITAPIYVLARAIKYGSFVERLDPVFLFLWNISTIIYISILFYTTVSIYCRLFRLQDARPLIIPTAVLIFAVAMAPRDFPGIVSEYIQDFRVYSNVIFFIFPVLVLIAAVLRRKKGESVRA